MQNTAVMEPSPRWTTRLAQTLDYPVYLIRRNPVPLLGFIVVALFIAVGIAAPAIATHDFIAIAPLSSLESPSGEFWFGTDQFGRDIFSRIIYATQVDRFIALTSVIPAFVIGTTLGAFVGYYQGVTDMVLMRIVDVVMAFPPFISAMGTAAALGAGTANIIYVVALIQTPIYVRLIRGEILSARERPYAEAARCS